MDNSFRLLIPPAISASHSRLFPLLSPVPQTDFHLLTVGKPILASNMSPYVPRNPPRRHSTLLQLLAQSAVLFILVMKSFSIRSVTRCAILLLGWLCTISPAFAQSADQLYQQATTAYDRGDIPESISLYQQALRLEPYSVPILTDLGVAFARTGHYAEAVEVYQKATKLDPSNQVVLLNLSLAWYKQGEFKQASVELEKLRNAHKDDQQSLYLLADCYLRLGRNADVVSLLDPVHKSNPNDLAVDYALGVALIRLGRLDRGEAVIDPILKSGNTAEANLLMGEAQLAAQDFKAAAASLQRAVQLNANLADAWSLYGRSAVK